MKTLSHTWFAEGYIDFELKKYTLLAYLQQIHKEFNQNKLYPQLSDIIFHHNNILHFKHSKQLLHRWRTEEAAIMVGFNTALNDDPQLTSRMWAGRQPLRIVLDRKLALPGKDTGYCC